MRDIKFRAWHSLHKEMVYFDKEKLCKDNYQQQHLCNLMRGDHGDVLMQFTDLQDKNGVDIYEGDIVKISYEKPYIQPVTYNANYGYEPIQQDCDYGGVTLDENMIKVIGNIHENPELLSANHE